MPLVAFSEALHMAPYTADLSQTSELIEYLYKHETDLEQTERKTLSSVKDFEKRLDLMKTGFS